MAPTPLAYANAFSHFHLESAYPIIGLCSPHILSQAYEHNLGVVEKHIENLATRSVGARARPGIGQAVARMDHSKLPQGRDLGVDRVPYGPSIRFTPG